MCCIVTPVPGVVTVHTLHNSITWGNPCEFNWHVKSCGSEHYTCLKCCKSSFHLNQSKLELFHFYLSSKNRVRDTLYGMLDLLQPASHLHNFTAGGWWSQITTSLLQTYSMTVALAYSILPSEMPRRSMPATPQLLSIINNNWERNKWGFKLHY